MRIKAKGERGRGVNTLMVMACMWPRDRYYMNGAHTPSNGRNIQPDQDEILSYIAQNGPCSHWDIELCTHQDYKPVMRHLAALQKGGKIAKKGKFYQMTNPNFEVQLQEILA